jgi:hypothetical protein
LFHQLPLHRGNLWGYLRKEAFHGHGALRRKSVRFVKVCLVPWSSPVPVPVRVVPVRVVVVVVVVVTVAVLVRVLRSSFFVLRSVLLLFFLLLMF